MVLHWAPYGHGKPLYHVPRSQVWQGSRGAQRGKVHLHVIEQMDAGRLKRKPGEALCGRRGWFERPREREDEFTDSLRCPRCVELGRRYGVSWPP